MGFTLQGAGPFLHWLTLGVQLVAPVLAGYVIYKLGSLPGAIAMVWAYLSPAKPMTSERLSETDINAMVSKLRQASQRLAALESISPDQRATVGKQAFKGTSPVEPAMPDQRTTTGA